LPPLSVVEIFYWQVASIPSLLDFSVISKSLWRDSLDSNLYPNFIVLTASTTLASNSLRVLHQVTNTKHWPQGDYSTSCYCCDWSKHLISLQGSTGSLDS